MNVISYWTWLQVPISLLIKLDEISMVNELDESVIETEGNDNQINVARGFVLVL
jgi:hypothetical protein